MDKKNKQNYDSVDELISFINKEKILKKVHYKKVFRFFSKCLKKSISEMYNKFSDLSNINESIISGINMIYHIFFILVNYTNNIKLTIFLLERAILLYTEFIIMSQDKKMVDEIYFVPNINDAVSFSFKKTIGPILIKDLDTINKSIISSYNSKFIKEVSTTLRNIFKLYFKTKYFNEESTFISLKIEENMETIDKIFQDKNILSDNEIDQFKKYSALCAEQNIKNTYGICPNAPEEELLNNSKDYTDDLYTETINLSLENFLNTINNEIVESLLNLYENKKYPDILKKINCILNNKDTLGIKLGKIKIILFMLNNEYKYLESNPLLDKNKLFILMKKMNTTLSDGSENIIIYEFKERLFDTLVYFNFNKKFRHNIDPEPSSFFIDVRNIDEQLDEILNFIR